MSAPIAWIPTPQEIASVECSIRALDEILILAGEIAGYIWRAGMANRGELRNRVAAMMSDNDASADGHTRMIRDKISPRSQQWLKRIIRTRQPVLVASDDRQELRFRHDEDFVVTNGLPITPKLGPIIVRLEGEVDNTIRLAVTRTLVWEEDSYSSELRSIIQSAGSAIQSIVSSSGQMVIDAASVKLLLDQASVDRSGAILPITVDNQLVSSACSPTSTDACLLLGQVVEGSCLTAKVTLGVTVNDGMMRYIRVEEPFLVKGMTLTPLSDVAGIRGGIMIPRYRDFDSAPIWIVSMYVSSGASGAHMSYDGTAWTQTPKSATKLAAIQDVIDRVLIGEMGFTASEIGMIFSDKKGHSSTSGRMRGLLTTIIGRARRDLKTESLLVKAVQQLAPLTDSRRVSFENRHSTHATLREGEWDPAVDLPALSRAVYLVAKTCGVFPQEVVRYLEDGEITVGPAISDIASHRQAKHSVRQPRVRRFILCAFDLFSRRSNPWSWRSNYEIDIHSDGLDRLLKRNLHFVPLIYIARDLKDQSVSPSDPRPTVDWGDVVQLTTGACMLNDLVASNPDVLKPFALSADNWLVWRDLLTGAGRQAMCKIIKKQIDTLLHYAWKESFPSFQFPNNLIGRLQRMVSILRREQIRETTGGQWGTKNYVAIALFYWLLKRYSAPEGVTYEFTPWELDMLTQWVLPFEDRADLPRMLRRHEDNIRRAYDRLLDTIAEEGWTVRSILGTRVSAATVAEFERLHAKAD